MAAAKGQLATSTPQRRKLPSIPTHRTQVDTRQKRKRSTLVAVRDSEYETTNHKFHANSLYRETSQTSQRLQGVCAKSH